MLRIAERNVAPEGCYAKSYIYRNVYKEQQFCRAVGKNVTAKAFSFNKVPQLSTHGLQQVQYQSLKEPQISVDFNKVWNLVRDQGVYPAALLESPLVQCIHSSLQFCSPRTII
jgi:hypothetical protein